MSSAEQTFSGTKPVEDRHRFDEAALDWLDSVDAVLQKPHTLARPLGEIRPRRGRRPRQAVG
jgi:hypothetical protein